MMNENTQSGVDLAIAMPDLLLGLAIGLVASLIFFAGLEWGMRRALRGTRPGLFLIGSFVVRALVLLGLGWWVVSMADTLWTGVGFLIAFFVVRTFAVRIARKAASLAQESTAEDAGKDIRQDTEWN